MSGETTTLSAQLRAAMHHHADAGRIAIRGPGSPVSYRELAAMIDGYAEGFHRWGVARGDLIGICAPKTASSVAAYFGAIQAGGCPCFIEGSLAPEVVAEQMDSVGMRHLVAEHDDAAERYGALAGQGIIVGRLGDLATDGCYLDPDLGPDDRAMILFTSGSTGQPKGVVLSHRALSCNAVGVIAHTGVTPADLLLHVMPLYHTNGINNQLIVPFLAGAGLVLVERFRAEETVQALRDWQPTYMTGVPTMYARMLPFLKDGERFPSLRFLRCGSAPITPVLHEEIETAFGVPLLVSYGLSEATCTSTMNPPADRRIGTIGTVIAGQTVALFSPATDEQVGQGAEGEIRITGPALMDGYLGGAQQPIVDGWLRTGDLGRFDGDGYLSITGRIKDVIIRGGENISPALVEGKIALDPDVSDCCVVGAPHKDLGEVPVAFVVLNAGAVPDQGRLQDLVRTHLSRMYVPAEVRFVDQLPLNPVGKVDRKALRGWLDDPVPAAA